MIIYTRHQNSFSEVYIYIHSRPNLLNVAVSQFLPLHECYDFVTWLANSSNCYFRIDIPNCDVVQIAQGK